MDIKLRLPAIPKAGVLSEVVDWDNPNFFPRAGEILWHYPTTKWYRVENLTWYDHETVVLELELVKDDDRPLLH